MFVLLWIGVWCISLAAQQHEPLTLKNSTAKKIIEVPSILAAATCLNDDIKQILATKIVEEKIKRPLYPILFKKPIIQKKANHKGVCGLETTLDTQQIVSLGCNGTMALCFENEIDNCNTITLDKSWYCAALKQSDQTLYMGDFNGAIGSINLADQSQQKSFPAHSQAINGLSFSPDEQHLISCSNDFLIKIWDLDTTACKVLLLGHWRAVKNAHSINAHQKIISGAADRTIRIWDIGRQKEEYIYTTPENINISRVARHPDEHLAVCGFNSGAIALLDIRTNVSKDFVKGHESVISALRCSEDGSYIASASWDGKIRIWDVRMMANAALLLYHQDWIQSLATLHSFRKIVSGSRDGAIKIWDISSVRALAGINTLERVTAQAALIAKENPQSTDERLAMLKKITEKEWKSSGTHPE